MIKSNQNDLKPLKFARVSPMFLYHMTTSLLYIECKKGSNPCKSKINENSILTRTFGGLK